jgi:hypothetical protein
MLYASSKSLLLFVPLAALVGAGCSAPAEGGDDDGVASFSGTSPGSGSATPGSPPQSAAPGAPSAPGDTSGASTNEAAPAPSFDGTTPAPGDTSASGTTPAAGTAPPAATEPPTPTAPATTDPNAPPAAPTEPAVPAPPSAAFLERGAWHGFASAAGVVAGTTVSTTDFAQRQPNQPFCLTGSVAPDPAFQGEAFVDFAINQEPVSVVAGQAAPKAAVAPTGNGIAYNFSKSVGTLLRLQLQPPGGGAPFCYEIPEAGGRGFAPYAQFNTACWDGSGQAYARQPIESVKFQVPGDDAVATAYGFCVGGFADGQGVNDAPTDIPVTLTAIRGQISGQFDRAKVLGANGESYIVQNNAWGATSSDGSEVIDYTGNGFTISRQSAGPNGNVPISFPSIFVGGNGYTGSNGSLSTRSDDRMPIRVGSIQSVQTRFRHNGGNGDYNVTYDVWFANQAPTGEYDTAQAAFLMVWLYKPGGRNAIGFNNAPQTVTVDNRTWRLYVGNRDEASDGGSGNAPVISYVNEGAAIPDYQFDLNVFIKDAVARSAAGTLRGATFNNNLFLTDIFGGFEIWGGGQGLRIDEFTAVVR